MCLLSIFLLIASLVAVYRIGYHPTRMMPSMQISTPIHQQLIPFHSILIHQNNDTQLQMEQVNQGEIYTPSTKKYLWRVLHYRQIRQEKEPQEKEPQEKEPQEKEPQRT